MVRPKLMLLGMLLLSVLAVSFGGAMPAITADAVATDDGGTLRTAADLNTDYSDFAVVVNGNPLQLDAPPLLDGETLLVPLRNIAEALGAAVAYDGDTQTVTAVKDQWSVQLRLGSREAAKNGSPVALAAAPLLSGEVTMVPLRFIGEAFGAVVKWEEGNRRIAIDSEDYLLPPVGSYENLKLLLKDTDYAFDTPLMLEGGMFLKEKSARSGFDASSVRVMDQAVTGQAASAEQATGQAAPTSNSPEAAAPDYSATNVQVQGVDEADVVKTDGEYIYQVNRDRIMIARAYPAGELTLSSVISLTGSNLVPLELYVDGDRLTVIGHSSLPAQSDDYSVSIPGQNAANPVNNVQTDSLTKKRIAAPLRVDAVKAVIYDIADKSEPQAVREVELEGSYAASRKIGSQVYIITNKYMDSYRIMNEEAELPAPAYRDSASSGNWTPASYDDIRYFPDSVLNTYLLIAGIDTARPEKTADVSVYLGSAQNIYASSQYMYATVSQYQRSAEIIPMTDNGTTPAKSKAVIQTEQSTLVYKFLLDEGNVRFAAKGQVPGTVLNQFSMDEHNGYFRIATTKGDMWRSDEFTSKNNLYVLDEAMNITGRIEDIAPGEQIYSVRFMGNRGYMVTFKKVDPLFVLDLSDPVKPSVLGKLKIPGYSDYLHPYDENHLIGFGKDAVEVANEWDVSGSSSTTAYYQGMKIAMFDVSDVANPKELFQTVIGDRGTDSELLRNHKALLFSREKNLLAFPITVAEVPDSAKKQGATAYGQFAFQGAYVYHVDLAEGFKLRGSITHMSAEEQAKAGGGWYEGSHNVERILYIGDSLYTLSKGEIRANDLLSLVEQKRLILP
ncbi:MAG: hypothetical protein K0R57_1791 [Paenibacillaceae bacterium]|nr:hypothetical protein [Paenibacillaceae bacterium]